MVTVELKHYGKAFLVLGKEYKYGDGRVETFPKSFEWKSLADSALEELKKNEHDNLSVYKFGRKFYIGRPVENK